MRSSAHASNCFLAPVSKNSCKPDIYTFCDTVVCLKKELLWFTDRVKQITGCFLVDLSTFARTVFLRNKLCCQ